MTQLLEFEGFCEIYSPQVLFEVSQKRSPVLKQIDELFRELKANPRDKSIHKKMEKKIQEFSRIRKIYFVNQKGEYNAFVFPKYKDNLPNIFNEIEKKKSKDFAEETPKYIDYAVVVFGELFIEGLTNRELTAVLLHELGHLYQHTANYSFLLGRHLFHHTRNIVRGTGLAMGVATLSNPAFLPLLIASFALSRSLTYNDHARELDADTYASKYGYGEEVAATHIKFMKKENKYRRKISWMKNIWDHIKKFIFQHTHPSHKDRICNAIEKMKNDHKKKYPKFKNKFNVIYADLKC